MGILDAPGLTKAAADAAYAPRSAAQRRMGAFFDCDPVAGRTEWPNGGVPSGASITRANFYTHHRAGPSAVVDVMLTYANGYGNDFSNQPTGPVTYTASVEYPIGSMPIPVTFRGRKSVTIDPQCLAQSDPLPLPVVIPAGAMFRVRTCVTVASGVTFLFGSRGWRSALGTPYIDVMEQGDSATLGDKTLSGTAPATTNSYCIRPVAITGHTLTPSLKSLVVLGDSITAQTNDYATPYPEAGGGYVRRAIDDRYPILMLAASGELSKSWPNPNSVGISAHPRQALLAGNTHMLSTYGANDVPTGTAVDTEVSLLYVWTLGKNYGLKVAQTTLTPYNTSTDSWATAVNQSVRSFEGNRVGVNTWLRDGAPLNTDLTVAPTGTSGAVRVGDTRHPLSAVIEVADTVETARNSGIWKTDGTANSQTKDGLHPETPMHITMANAVRPQLDAFLAI